MTFVPRVRHLAIAVPICFSPLAAHAGGFQINEQGASGLGAAYAGAAAAAWDASTVWWNPAGMTAIPGRQMVAAGNILWTNVTFQDRGSTLPAGQPLNAPRTNGGNAGGSFFIPSFFVTWQVAPQWWLGLGVNGPFGLTTKWEDGFVGRFHAIESDIRTYNINPSVAWKPVEWFSIGAGVNAMYLDGTFSQYTNYAGATAAACGQLPAAARPGCLGQIPGLNAAGLGQGLTTAQGNSWAWGWNVGVTFDITPATRIGLAYRSTVKHDVEGDITFNNVPRLNPPLGGALQQSLRNGPIQAEVKLPDVFSVALAQKLGQQWRLLANYTWTGWDSIQELAFNRQGPGAPLPPTELKFKDAWRVGVGAEWQVNSALLMRFGVAYDRTPVQDEYRTPRLPDTSRWWLSIGGRYSWAPNWAVDFGYTYLLQDDGSINLTYNVAATGKLVGNTTGYSSILGAQVRWNF
jgi:long-chain fatty acid transport protein